MRKCVGCNTMKSKQELLRILKTQEEEILLDITGKRNGRGAYLCKNLQCLITTVRNKSLERSLGMKIPKEIYENLKKEMNMFEL
ncbi:MAG: YlxR family protein [Lachnospiraceae bacterium]|nr:YlxR family protein [Lachnospiraceae bacterium]